MTCEQPLPDGTTCRKPRVGWVGRVPVCNDCLVAYVLASGEFPADVTVSFDPAEEEE
jgi:hypothetical protein